LAPAVEDLAIPDTVQAVLKARIDRLDPESREVLRSASVIGRQFGVGLLADVVPSPSRLPAALDALRAAGLLQRTALVPEPVYRFKHALTLDVTYESLLARQRRERHALVAEAIEARQEEGMDEVSEQLASHFAAAEMWDKAVEHGFNAAHRAAGLWQTEDAMRILERVRRWIGRRSSDPTVRDPDLIRLLLEQERHLETLGRRSAQARMIDELKGLVSREPGPESAIVLVREGELRTLQGAPEAARAAFAESIRVADACGAESERIMALRGVGHLHWRNGQYEQALPALEEVAIHDRAHASKTVLLRDLVNLGRVLRECGDFDRAREIGDEILTLAEETASPVDIVYALNYRGHLLRAMGRPEEALHAFEDASRRFESAHLPVRLSFHLLAKAALHLELGQVEASMETYQQSVALARRAGRADNLANALTLYGDALCGLGRPAEAVSLFREAVTILRGLGIDAGLAAALGKLAMAAEASGDRTAADCWGEVREVAEVLGNPEDLLEAAEREARLRGDDPAARAALLDLALETAREVEDRETERRVLNSLALLAWRQGRLEVAATRFEAAAACPGAPEIPGVFGVIANGWGAVLTELERYDEAREVLLRARDANREAGDRAREADSESALGGVSRSTGDLTRAFDHYEACRDLRRAVGDRPGEAWALYRLAQVAARAGSDGRAADLYGAALEAARGTGDTELTALVTGERGAIDATTSPS
jgi:tetratricopeptide (TPR) repeat protein